MDRATQADSGRTAVLPDVVRAATAGGSFRVETTCYSDYFATVTGCEISWCDDEYASAGTLDGAYKRVVMTNCNLGTSNRYCYVKNGSSWSSISCPQNLPDDHPCW